MFEKAWRRLFPDGGYRISMNLRTGDAVQFWRPTAESERVLAERKRWIGEFPERHLLFAPGSEAAVKEAVAWLSAAAGQSFADAREAGCGLEPDWVLLAGEESLSFPVIGGAVAFPSDWALEEKLSLPLVQVHAPVPGLESAIGARITTFLARMAPGTAWERENWGLSAVPDLNQHPAMAIPRLEAGATLDSTWLRQEKQFLTRLPRTGAILFGIRVSSLLMSQVLGDHPGLAPYLALAMETMPADLAAYKGMTEARASLIQQLRAELQT